MLAVSNQPPAFSLRNEYRDSSRESREFCNAQEDVGYMDSALFTTIFEEVGI
jgi:hypothetical protein